MKARNFITLAGLALLGPLTGRSEAQVPSAFLRQNQMLPGGAAGERVVAIDSLAQAPEGGWALSIRTSIPPSPGWSYKIWGNVNGGAGTVLRESGVVAGYEQLFLEESIGLGGGAITYLPCSTLGGFCDVGVWVDDTPVVLSGTPGPLPGTTWSDYYNDASATRSGDPVFLGRFDGPAGIGQGLFLGAPPQPLLLPGHQPANLPVPVLYPTVGDVAVSPNGAHFVAGVALDCTCPGAGGSVLLDGDAVVLGGVPFRTGEPVPATIGAPGESWRGLLDVTVNDAGDYAMSGFLATSSQTSWETYIARDGGFFLRAGDPIDGGTWESAISLHLSTSGELYHISAFEDATGAERTGIFVERELIHAAGDPIDWTGDGVPDAGFGIHGFFNAFIGERRFSVSDDGTILFGASVEFPTGQFRAAYFRLRHGQGTSYCLATPNSTGVPAAMSAFGSPFVADRNLRLRASSVPTGSTGYFLVGDVRAAVNGPGGSVGRLCVGGPIGRFVGPGQVAAAGPDERLEIELDLAALPRPTGPVAVLPGDTWRFTAWYRDSVGGVPVSNFANGLEVRFR